MKARYLDMAGVGRALTSPVSRHAVVKWRERYPQGVDHSFPEPDVIIGAWEIDPNTGDFVDDQDERGVPGWSVERLSEIETWRAALPGRTGRPRKAD
ncbi:hypothetical protein ACOBQX_17955 [Actinokineospora sp. G85]|uniref:hypothetical protein n=1 Tax=Actinokineospora sp. G85 TaxID=3406626 RepID=UPI003C744E84